MSILKHVLREVFDNVTIAVEQKTGLFEIRKRYYFDIFYPKLTNKTHDVNFNLSSSLKVKDESKHIL